MGWEGFWVIGCGVGDEKGLGGMECYDLFMGHQCEPDYEL